MSLLFPLSFFIMCVRGGRKPYFSILPSPRVTVKWSASFIFFLKKRKDHEADFRVGFVFPIAVQNVQYFVRKMCCFILRDSLDPKISFFDGKKRSSEAAIQRENVSKGNTPQLCLKSSRTFCSVQRVRVNVVYYKLHR